jgi:hypothetical protein
VEIHHVLPLERPECWVTCDSIALFLENECQFPLELEEGCYYSPEEHEFLPSRWRQGYGLAGFFVKKASVELIDLYRHFVSPVNPRFFATPSPLPPFVECLVVPPKDRSVHHY